MHYIPWPSAVVDAFRPNNPTAADASDVSSSGAGSSSSSSSGPRLHIGLAEGQPHAIGPDHLGRADYHGPSVNLAARMLTAAAAAGAGGSRVVTSVEVAQSIFR